MYALVNEKIIAQLEKGTVPWKKPWTEAGLPRNCITKKPYRGINLILLASLGYEHNWFLSFKQVNDLKGKVKKGEHGHMVVFWNYTEQEQKSEDGTVPTDTPKEKGKPYLRYYQVFNVAQCENLPEGLVPMTEERSIEPIKACEGIIKGIPNCPAIRHKEASAFYDPLRDIINMPKQKTFSSDAAYYGTLFHELVHSTGHRTRLHRASILDMAEFGSEPYSLEELVAEIGSCYLQSYAGLDIPVENSTAYVQSWLKKLQDDKRFIFTASSAAQKATDYILDIQTEYQS
ncbi:MAG: DUF1738 domain-containing protein [Taibaiella sp.]|nr:DUF1738 domain-containing protein [Taibaiella sp.]